jgi:hypothetical protein
VGLSENKNQKFFFLRNALSKSVWQTTLVVKDAEAIADRLRLNQTTFISPSVVAIPEQALGCKKGMLARDPEASDDFAFG